MEISRYASDLLLSNMYVIREGNHAVVIDPFASTDMAEGIIIDRILLTHEHYDHISGVNLWKEKTGAPVFCSEPCALNIQDPKKNLARIFEVFCSLQTWISLEKIPESDPKYSCTADETFSDTCEWIWNGHQFRMFEMPGHSDGSTGIILDEKYFFSGDSLMEDKPVELRFPGGSRKKWEQTGLPRLSSIPEGIIVYPGHFREFVYKKEGGH